MSLKGLIKQSALLLMFLGFTTISAQTKVDSLTTVLKTITDASEKLSVLDKLTREMIRENHKDLIPNLKQYMSLAKELEEYDLMASKSRFLIQQHLIKGENVKGLQLIDSMLTFKSKFKKINSEAHLLLKRGGVNYATLNYKKANEDYKKAAKLFMESKDSIFAADGYLFSGQVNSIEGDFVAAIHQFEKAYNLYQALKDFDYTYMVGEELNTIYLRNGLKYEAAKKSKELLNFIRKNKLIDALAAFYKTDLVVNLKENNLILAKKNLDSLNVLNPKIKGATLKKNNIYHTEILSTLYYLKKQNLNSAKFHLSKVLKMEEEGMIAHAKLEISQLKATYYKEIGEYDKALELLEKNKKMISKEDKNNYTSQDTEKMLADIYHQLGNHKKAGDHLRNYIQIKDSLHAASIVNAYAYQQTKFETAQKEKEIVEQKAAIKELELDKELEKSKRNTLLAIFFSIILVGIGIWWKEKMKKEHLKRELIRNQNELTTFTQQILQKSKEQERLISQLEELKEKVTEKETLNAIQDLVTAKILTKDDWYNFKNKFTKVHPYFFNDIKEKGYKLTKSEERLVALEKLGLDNSEIANMLGVSLDTIFMSRYRLRKKIAAPKEVSITEYLS